jgi:6-pyruvoyl-tetrahydropterin synthase
LIEDDLGATAPRVAPAHGIAARPMSRMAQLHSHTFPVFLTIYGDNEPRGTDLG